MSMKWSEEEVDAVLRMRDVLKEELATVANNAEVVGDRCFIRFYRGHNRDVDTACTFMRNYLNWRVDKNVDSIRENIVKNGMNNPLKFPYSDIILRIMPQTVCNALMCDNLRRPLTVNRMNFSISDFAASVTDEQFNEWLIYCMEYHSVILEQLAQQKEQDVLREAELNGTVLSEPYGVIMQICAIRNLDGLSFEHVGPYGLGLFNAVVSKYSFHHSIMNIISPYTLHPKQNSLVTITLSCWGIIIS
jgi:hypothetical protein